jgi:2-polyprenyl-3-methyl-5-hydroxy-6-metoxy-1,4-benzoquinol methylase
MALQNIVGELIPYIENGVQIEETFGKYKTKLLRSDNDHFTFDFYPSFDELSVYYDQVYPNTGGRPFWYNADNNYADERWVGVVPAIEQWIEHHFGRRDITIHEVGCGFGGLVAKLRSLGLDASGTDLNTKAISDGRTRKGNQHIHGRSVYEFLAEYGSQDMILMQHFLEHVTDPVEILKNMKDHINPGGLIFGRVPNSQFYLAKHRTIRSHWYGYPHHLHYFSAASIEKILTHCGYTVLMVGATDAEMFGDRQWKKFDEIEEVARERGDWNGSWDDLVNLLITRNEAKEVQFVARVD